MEPIVINFFRLWLRRTLVRYSIWQKGAHTFKNLLNRVNCESCIASIKSHPLYSIHLFFF